MNQKIQDIIKASIETKQQLLQDAELLNIIEKVSDVVVDAFKKNKKIYLCGNGGSAADAQHIAAEFSGSFYNRKRKALPAEALHTNTSYLTSVANDYGYDEVYARMIDGVGQPGDVLIGLSTSGNSPNIVRAFEAARNNNLITVALTGTSGGALIPFTDYLVNIPSNDTPRIQESHIMTGHIICQLVEEKMFT